MLNRIVASFCLLMASIIICSASPYHTSKGRSVDHCHMNPCWPRELNATEMQTIRDLLRSNHPNVTEIAPPTRNYNCHGRAHAESHGWFNSPVPFIEDDYLQMTIANPKPGDVVVYVKNGQHTHSAIVKLVSGSEITLDSKWGQWPRVLHKIREVPAEYGDPIYMLRRRNGGMMTMAQQQKGVSGKEALQLAISRLKEPSVYAPVFLASTPEVARNIVREMKEVQTILEFGAAAGPEVASLFREASKENEIVAMIALFILAQVPDKSITTEIADFLKRPDTSEMARVVGLDAFLASRGITKERFILESLGAK